MTSYPANFAKVDDRVWRGARPTPCQAIQLHRYGVETALNLEWEQSDEDLWPKDVRRFLIRDWEPLPYFAPSISDDHVIHALHIIQITKFAPLPSPITYVHCRSGQNRTGVIIAAYRLVVLEQGIDQVLEDFNLFKGWWTWVDWGYIRTISQRLPYFQSKLPVRRSTINAGALDE